MAYRVVQWGTGAVGVEAIRGILDQPDLELVGVKVYSDEKAGIDAGALAGREATGVIAAKDGVLTGDVDCVLRPAASVGRRGLRDLGIRRQPGDHRVRIPSGENATSTA